MFCKVTRFPPIYKLPPIPAPPETTKAPELVLVEVVVFVKLTLPVTKRSAEILVFVVNCVLPEYLIFPPIDTLSLIPPINILDDEFGLLYTCPIITLLLDVVPMFI